MLFPASARFRILETSTVCTAVPSALVSFPREARTSTDWTALMSHSATRSFSMATVTSQQQELRVHIRWMIRCDMPEVVTIEAQSFEFPLQEDDFIRCLRQRKC